MKTIVEVQKMTIEFTCGEEQGYFEAINLEAANNFLSYLVGKLSASDFLAYAVDVLPPETMEAFIQMINACTGAGV